MNSRPCWRGIGPASQNVRRHRRRLVPYEGKLKIENDDFELNAERLILRGNEIAFSLQGNDEFGEFKIEGIATKSTSGFYMAPKLPLLYMQYAGEDEASIKFNSVEKIEEKNLKRCKVVGAWIQSGDSWDFEGKLKEIGETGAKLG